MKKIKKIHFVGIKGVGMASLAVIAKQAGLLVTGSDIDQEFITDKTLKEVGIVPFVGFDPSHIGKVDLLITTGAHGGFDNPEVIAAKKKEIPVVTQGQAVGMFMQGEIFGKTFEGISVAGTHGKTTTTAMLATIFKTAGQDPTYIIGTGSSASLGSSGHFGKGRFFIAEADEYATEPQYDKTPKFLWQHPKTLIITNIEHDHPDVYASIDDVRKAFVQFTQQLPQQGLLIICGDDPQAKLLLKDFSGNVITYGFSSDNDYVLTKVTISGNQTFFWGESEGVSIGEFVINVSGQHNALNAVASLIVARECGISLDSIKKGLAKFSGSQRRFEFIGTLPTGAHLYDDYAHHPTEIKKTLQAFRQSYPTHKLVCIFQPHTYSRTKALFDDFVTAFDIVDTVILTQIYPSLREAVDLSFSSEKLVKKMQERRKDVLFLPTLADVVEYTQQKAYNNKTILITMGAGDVYTIGKELLENFK